MGEAFDQIDYYVFIIIVIIDLILIGFDTKHWAYYVISILLIGIVLPDWSCSREVARNVSKNGPAMDSFELFYTLLVFPLYWKILFLHLLYLVVKPKVKNWNDKENLLIDSFNDLEDPI